MAKDENKLVRIVILNEEMCSLFCRFVIVNPFKCLLFNCNLSHDGEHIFRTGNCRDK